MFCVNTLFFKLERMQFKATKYSLSRIPVVKCFISTYFFYMISIIQLVVLLQTFSTVTPSSELLMN